MNPWDIPPQHGVVNEREIKADSLQIQSCRYDYGVVKPGSNAYGWVSINRIDVYETAGEHVAGYDKAYRWGTAPTWGRCIEVRDFSGKGALWGLEIDVLSKGRSADCRRGMGIVFGRNEPGDERPHYDFGVDLLPNGFNLDEATLGTAFHASVPCENIVAGPAGSWATFDGRDKNIGFVFTPQGFCCFGMKTKMGNPPDFRKAALAIQVETGEVLSFGRQIIGAVQKIPST